MLNMFFESEDVLPMWIAETEFKACPELLEALKKRADEGYFCYEDKPKGVSQSLVGWFERRHGLKMNPGYLQYTISVLAGLAALLEEFSSENDGIIIQPPVYQAFTMILNGINRRIEHKPLKLENGRYSFDLDDLEQRLKDDLNSILLLCSPHNPVARVWTREELSQIAQLCEKHGVLIVSDEIHCDTILGDNQFISMTEVCRGLTDNLITIGSAGKSFGIPSLSDAFIYTENENLRQKIGERLFRYHINKNNAFSNTAMETVYSLGDKWVDSFTTHVQNNVDLIREYLTSNNLDLKLIEPEGTYQVWLDAREHQHNDDQLHRVLVEKGKIGLARGSGYGPGGEKFFRMNIGCPQSTLSEAMDGIKRALYLNKEGAAT